MLARRAYSPADLEKLNINLVGGDPYGGALKLYESTRDEMVEAIPSLIEFLKTQVSAKPAR